MNHFYTCEQCGNGATLCVSDWGYIAAFCDECLRERKNYLKLPAPERPDPGTQTVTVAASAAS